MVTDKQAKEKLCDVAITLLTERKGMNSTSQVDRTINIALTALTLSIEAEVSEGEPPIVKMPLEELARRLSKRVLTKGTVKQYLRRLAVLTGYSYDVGEYTVNPPIDD